MVNRLCFCLFTFIVLFMSTPFAVLLQYALPKRLLTQCMGRLASRPLGGLTTFFIHSFIKRYRVNMNEAANPDPKSYKTFNDFFGRALRPGVRPLSATALVSPVDGTVSQLGAISGERIFQAKGHDYSCTQLLAGRQDWASLFHNGLFATLYLSPADYHRVHMPCDGILKSMTYVPGDLFSVNPATAQAVPGLFARNERVVCMFDSDKGPFSLILVGATIVGSMQTVWHGVVNPPRSGKVIEWQYSGKDIRLLKGQEMGRFLLGSTVVLLFPEGAYHFDADWDAQKVIRQGQSMGDAIPCT